MTKCELHIHTKYYSDDSFISYEDLLQTSFNKNIKIYGITEHNSIYGALKVKEKDNPFDVIIGSEILTLEGEVIGLFLEKDIKPYQCIEKTVYEIKNQGGIVLIPHPFDRMRKSAIDKNVLDRIVGMVDIIETFNSRNIFSNDDYNASEYAKKHNKLTVGGSDAHTNAEIGRAIMGLNSLILDDGLNAKNFMKYIKDAELLSKQKTYLGHFFTKYKKTFRRC